jgi:hypothetical protein
LTQIVKDEASIFMLLGTCTCPALIELSGPTSDELIRPVLTNIYIYIYYLRPPKVLHGNL